MSCFDKSSSIAYITVNKTPSIQNRKSDDQLDMYEYLSLRNLYFVVQGKKGIKYNDYVITM